MVAKTKKYRGSRTHGRGRKAGRGAGLRGGRGLAGLHKHKYMWMVKYRPDHFGRSGFKRPEKAVKSKNCINLNELEEALPKFIERGIVTKEKDIIHIDLEKIGIDKLLANGRINTKFKITVQEASARAKEKIEACGGQIVLTGAIETKKEPVESSDKEEKSEGLDGGGA